MGYADLIPRVAAHLRQAYGLDVREGPVSGNATGDFDGVTILLRPDLEPEMKLFILCHLFGHTVQFNQSDGLRRIGLKAYGPGELSPESVREIIQYEQDASRYAIAMLPHAGVVGLDQWLSDWSHGDLAYLLDIYRSGERPQLTLDFLRHYTRHYVRPGSPLLEPLPVPPFTPRRWEFRSSF